MAERYYGKTLDIGCPVCNRPMKSRLLSGGWSIDCSHDSLLTFVETGENRCMFDHYEWNQELQDTEEKAIQVHETMRTNMSS